MNESVLRLVKYASLVKAGSKKRAALNLCNYSPHTKAKDVELTIGRLKGEDLIEFNKILSEVRPAISQKKGGKKRGVTKKKVKAKKESDYYGEVGMKNQPYLGKVETRTIIIPKKNSGTILDAFNKIGLGNRRFAERLYDMMDATIIKIRTGQDEEGNFVSQHVDTGVPDHRTRKEALTILTKIMGYERAGELLAEKAAGVHSGMPAEQVRAKVDELDEKLRKINELIKKGANEQDLANAVGCNS